MKAVSHDEAALEFAADELKADREIVMQAVSQDSAKEGHDSEVIQEPLPLKPGILVKNRSF